VTPSGGACDYEIHRLVEFCAVHPTLFDRCLRVSRRFVWAIDCANGDFLSQNGGATVPDWLYQSLVWSSDGGINGGPFVGPDGTISQTLPTVPGLTYLLQFSAFMVFPGFEQDGPPYAIRVNLGDQSPIVYPLGGPHWVTETATFTADSSQTVLEFSAVYPALPGLDHVLVTPVSVPETPCTAMIGLGAVMFAAAGFRSKYLIARCSGSAPAPNSKFPFSPVLVCFVGNPVFQKKHRRASSKPSALSENRGCFIQQTCYCFQPESPDAFVARRSRNLGAAAL